MLGGTGQIGSAVALRLAAAGWEVTVAARTRERLSTAVGEVAEFVSVDREAGLSLPRDVDALVDVISMTRADAEQLLGLKDRIGALVAISSASVYTDDEGRTLDEATDLASFPRFPVPIREAQPTTVAGNETYSTEKVEMEQTLLEQDDLPAVIVRPCAVYGPGGEFAREQFFVKRIVDGRRLIVLPAGGRNVFHPTSVHNLAELVRVALERPRSGVFNCGDPEPPSVLEIGRAVARVLEHEWTECLLPGAAVDGVGRNPWGRFEAPIVLDMAKAEAELRYRPVVHYADAVAETCRWLIDERPPLGDYMETFFDYTAEDSFVRDLAAGVARG